MVDDNPKSHLAELAEPPKVQKESWVLVDSRRTKNGLKSLKTISLSGASLHLSLFKRNEAIR
jgi:hypothetical protein